MEDGVLLGNSYQSTRNKNISGHIQEQFHQLVNKLQPNIAPDQLTENFIRIAELADEAKVERERMELWIRSCIQEVRSKVSSWKNELPAFPIERLKGMKFNEQLKACSDYVRECLLFQPASSRSEIVKAKQYIEDRISQKVTLDEVAESTNLTPTYFSSLFRRETGESLIDYINRRKMEKVMEMIKEKDYTNMTLCEAIGIYNEKYFCTLFKQHYGVTPQKFRKQFIRN